jgi:Zn-dependent M28 family amino/carboxypeptidase
MDGLSKRVAVLAALVVVWTSAVRGALVVPSVADVVDEVGQDTYQHYLDDLLYTHTGENRGSGPGHDLARDNISAELSSFGLGTSVESLSAVAGRGGPQGGNVVATLLGTTRPDDLYILAAHYDSVGNPGADDNASGVAGVLEAARVLSHYDFEATLVFIAFDEEEKGLVGSTAYAAQHLNDDIQSMISMDMIAYNASGSNRARIYGNDYSAPLKDALGQAVALYGQGLTAVDSGVLDLSDHAPFQNLGFEAVLLIEYDVWSNPYLHDPRDTVDTPGYIDYAFATNMVRSAVGYLAESAVLVPEPATVVLLALGILLARPRRRFLSR